MGLCAQTEWTYLEFQFTATVSVSMATKSSDLDDQKTGANIHTEGHTLTPPNGWHGPEETEVFGSIPSQSLSQSPLRKPIPDCHVLQKDWGQRQWDQWTAPPMSPLPSPDCGFESDWSSVLTSSSVSSRSDRSGGSRHSHCNHRCCRESRGHMKINLPIFKDEDTKDAVTYQSWC